MDLIGLEIEANRPTLRVMFLLLFHIFVGNHVLIGLR